MARAKLTAAERDGRTARRTATRRAILDAATTLFARKGVTSTSIDEIAELAGTAKGSVFYNFTNKSGLVAELFETYSAQLARDIAAQTAEKSGAELRRAIVVVLLSELRANTAAARVIAAESFRTDRDWTEAVGRWRAVASLPIVEDYVAQHGEAARPAGHILAASIIGATLTAGLEWLAYRPQTPQATVEQTLLQTLRLDA